MASDLLYNQTKVKDIDDDWKIMSEEADRWLEVAG
jgi:hypothetical protein